MRPPTPDQLIARLAERQHGVFTFAHALGCGFTPDVVRHRVRTGRWRRVYRGVYALAGVVPTLEHRAMGAALAAGAGAGASHRTAGALFRFEGIRPTNIEVISARRVRLKGVHAHVSTTLRSTDLTKISGVPVTTPSRTLVDLACVLDEVALEDALDDAIRRGIVHPRRLQSHLESLARRGMTGIGVLLALVQTRTTITVPGSSRESQIRRMLRLAGLPEPVRQHSIYDDNGGFVARPDLSYPALRLYIEYDGAGHESPRQRRIDIVRQNRLSALGWRPLRFSREDLRGPPGAIVDIVRAASSVANRR